MIDFTGKIGPFLHHANVTWPMYSFDRPAYILWNAVANGLIQKGWSEIEAKEFLQSKDIRHALDGELGDMLNDLGMIFASKAKKLCDEQTNIKDGFGADGQGVTK